MKNLIFIFAILFSVLANAQTKTTPTEASANTYISGAGYFYVADVLTNVDTTTFVCRVKDNNRDPGVQNFTIKLYLDWVSGTAGGVLTAYKSIDGVNYAAIDTTITATSVTADIMDTETIDIDDFAYPYLKLIYIQSGTAVTNPNIYVYSKGN